MLNKKIVFLSGTRADFGKIKSLIKAVESEITLTPYIFVTGMHLIEKYGSTVIEIEKCNFEHIEKFSNHTSETTMDLTLSKTISGFSEYIKKIEPDLIVVHGDRVEALAGAIVGSLNNILVAHIEGGEVSGTIDELIRHSVSKMSHIHYVSNDIAKNRLIQMGELSESIFTIGSPDVDIMFSDNLPSIQEVKNHYEIPFKDFAVLMFHPVTTEYDKLHEYTKNLVDALIDDTKNYVVIYPNNDLGSELILDEFKRLNSSSRFRIFPSIRFEYFLTLLKKSKFIIGNSSAGIREAPYYGIPTINIGSRQENRSLNSHIINTDYSYKEISAALHGDLNLIPKDTKSFGNGNSAALFIESIKPKKFWNANHQKQFVDFNHN